MRRYKVYLRSGTVLTITADGVYEWNDRLTFHNGDNSVAEGSFHVVANFKDWEGYQLLTLPAAKETEKSGS